MEKVEFPAGFVFGTATAAYQIEGAWNEDGKGPSIWDAFVRQKGKILTGQRGDRAVDHYHRFREDIDLMSAIGAKAYRFSLSWPRIFPEGTGKVNQPGIDFYSRLVDGLLEAGIAPYVTLFHWDMPLALERRGGFSRRDSVGWFVDYARVAACALGDRVKNWITINEPWVFAIGGYLLGDHAPGRHNPWKALAVAHHLNLANAEAFEAIKAERPDSKVGVTLSMISVHPRTERPADREAADVADQFISGFFLDPLFHGRMPEPLWRRFRMFRPHVAPDDMAKIRGKFDFIGLNNYTRERAYAAPFVPFLRLWMTGRYLDGHEHVENGVQRTSMGWEVYPKGIYEMITKLKTEYGNPPIFITENGAAFEDRLIDGRVVDPKRIAYLHDYLAMIRRAIAEGADVRGYFVWTLMDNFEWGFGFSKRFGLVYVDTDTLERTIKESGHWFRELATTGRMPPVEFRSSDPVR